MNSSTFEGSDEQAVELVRQGDKEKFGVLMDRYEAKLFRYGKRFLSGQENIEDVVQEVFLKAYANIRDFDTSQRFSPWIYRIAHNTYVNALKKRSRTPIHIFDLDLLLSHPAEEDPGALERERKEMREMIDACLDKLRPPYREAIILHYLEELKYEEIAEILHVPLGTVGVRLKRAKEALRIEWEKMGFPGGQQ